MHPVPPNPSILPAGAKAAADTAPEAPAAAWAQALPPDRATPARRRLWQLPPEHRALVVGLSWPPATLRALAEHTLGRLHHVRVELQGSDADVLASVLHDLASRNPLSDALQRALERQHAAVQARCAALRDAEALRQAWQQALAEGIEMGSGVGGGMGSVAATLWALLTHPLGTSLQDALLADTRAWLFANTRVAQALAASRAQAVSHDAALRAQVLMLQQRLQAREAAHDAERRALALELARVRGERAAALSMAAVGDMAGVGDLAGVLDLADLADGRTRRPPRQDERACQGPVQAAAPASHAAPAGPAAAASRRTEPPDEGDAPARPASAPIVHRPAVARHPSARTGGADAIQGRRVLCVGGMPGAQSRYRELVETAGAHFDFHDGGLEQGLHRLDRQLRAADLVVCQAGCLNHEAYRRVKAHCRRAIKPCLFAERPSLAHFARTLGLPEGRA